MLTSHANRGGTNGWKKRGRLAVGVAGTPRVADQVAHVVEQRGEHDLVAGAARGPGRALQRWSSADTASLFSIHATRA